MKKILLLITFLITSLFSFGQSMIEYGPTCSGAYPRDSDKIFVMNNAGDTLCSAYFIDVKNYIAGSSGWSLTGNAGTNSGSNFIGTTDSVDLVIKTNNVQSGRIYVTEGSASFGRFSLPVASNANNAFGTFALSSAQSSANNNNAFGYVALASNTTGYSNVGIGSGALSSNVDGFTNTAIGFGTLQGTISGSDQTAIGRSADVMYDLLTNATALGAHTLVGCSNCGVLGDTTVVAQWGIGYSTPSFFLPASTTGIAVNGNGYFSGNVGIGTTIPQATLAVNGTISIKEDSSAGFTIYTLKVHLDHSQIQTASGTPIDIGIPPSGSGHYYRITAFDCKTSGSTIYTSTTLFIGGADVGTYIMGNLCLQQPNQILAGQSFSSLQVTPSTSEYGENDTIAIWADSDSVVGDLDVDCYITVEKVKL